jgi:hypothetical protein
MRLFDTVAFRVIAERCRSPKLSKEKREDFSGLEKSSFGAFIR